jgi:hypothetical protein
VGLKSLKSLNLTNVYPNNKNNKKKKKNNKVKSKPLELRSRVKMQFYALVWNILEPDTNKVELSERIARGLDCSRSLLQAKLDLIYA